ncbi:hypothetical protein Poly41_09380 [Novipirellula artificiosorum]|uniref:Mannose-6-phosphate isomerase n=1 Tax=Novipirellula artificiosorum TaxID=2528016 RepID=A0A5C6E661_9BACT|nr:hypothetical protein Poly41_09380 [Novipirellula artificiosorum]
MAVPDSKDAVVKGWDAIADRLRDTISRRDGNKTVVAIDCYTGVDVGTISRELRSRLKVAMAGNVEEAMKTPEAIDSLVAPFLGGDDPVFGFLSGLTLAEFFDAEKVERLRRQVAKVESGIVLIVGCGASMVEHDVLVYADMPRWEGQLRYRRGEADNLGVKNRSADIKVQYKRAFFVDWRVCDRWKKPLISSWDFLLDTTIANEPKLADGDAVRRGLSVSAHRPFRVVPFFDPAPRGGQWMKQFCDLDRDQSNFGWCFDCVPEENSLLLSMGDQTIELPAMDLVLDQPVSLLGDAVHGRSEAAFPIRFDFLDTIGGGNLSFQVHPLTEYIQNTFGMHYTQDESYYMLDAGPDACVYLGLKDGIDPDQMIADLESAQAGGAAFDADRYANCIPAKKHDHFLIPAGTVHCSGAESMVLEISRYDDDYSRPASESGT